MTGMTHRFSLLTACALVACGTAPSARPASHATAPAAEPTPAEPTPAPAEPPPPPAPPAPPAPRVDAPPTPPRTYDAAACTARVATFRERLQAVVAHVDRFYEVTDGIKPVSVADDGLSAPAVVVEVRDTRDRFCSEWGGAWGITVRAGRRTLRFDGRDRVAKAARAVTKLLPAGGRIGVELEHLYPLVSLEPLLVELSAIAPLQFAVALDGAPYALPTDAPAWARERLAAIPSLPQSMLEPRQTTALRASIATASGACSAVPSALAEAANSPGASIAHEIVALVPEAVARCACENLDVDALEAFLVWSLGGDTPTVSRGWLEVRFAKESALKLSVWQLPSALHDLTAIPRDARVGGVQLLDAAGRAAAPPAADRCD